jgi:hypothetical protein
MFAQYSIVFFCALQRQATMHINRRGNIRFIVIFLINLALRLSDSNSFRRSIFFSRHFRGFGHDRLKSFLFCRNRTDTRDI